MIKTTTTTTSKLEDPRNLSHSAEAFGEVICTVLKVIGDIMLACFMASQQ